ncbi:AHH domain-containing protein [Sphingorhabdus sp.]|uniref:AHH domain-containing protein n=1 Tax=Sphingorhabdus sp. TaxID=1902408 RepID=UPI0035B0D696|nr:AHH domain-containing protein [Sphingomonadaceae bacterium]
MPTFREVRTRVRITGFQCHHLIPLEVCSMASFSRFFLRMRAFGFVPNDFEANGMHLPSSEKLAEIFRLPLHRGPHPIYNSMVAERLAQIEMLGDAESCMQLRLFVLGLRRGLRIQDQQCRSQRREPLLTTTDMRRLDSDADFLFRITKSS